MFLNLKDFKQVDYSQQVTRILSKKELLNIKKGDL